MMPKAATTEDESMAPEGRQALAPPLPGSLRLPMPGELIDDTYRVITVLGRGGMGVVLLALDEKLQREVAIKVIAAEAIRRDDSNERFLREARAMAGVQHENVVRIYSYGHWEGAPYFVMEYVPGTNVADWLERWDDEALPPPSFDEVLGILDQVCRGLEAIHDAGIVHADVKPGNVLIGPAFRVAVTDLGLVRDLGQRDDNELIVGTPSYIAPEVVYSDAPVFDRRADVYSLGVMAFEMFTGVLPYPIENVRELFDTHLAGTPPPLASEVRGDLPAALDEVLWRALSRDIGTRYSSATEFRQALFAAREAVTTEAKQLRVVLADDDDVFRAIAEETVRFAYPGAEVLPCADGASALQTLDRMPANLAIIDLDMPGLNGIELTASLRAQKSTGRMPIIVVTARGGATDWQLLQSLGADGFLVKPMDPYALVAMVRRVLGQSVQPPPMG